MPSFQGKSDTTYPVNITTRTLLKLRSDADIDLMKVVDGELLSDIYGDPVVLANILYVVCSPDMTLDEFCDEVSGDGIDAGIDALLEALIDFFPSAHRRTLEVLMQTSTEGQMRMLKVLNSPAVSEAMDREFSRLETELVRNLNELGNKSSS